MSSNYKLCTDEIVKAIYVCEERISVSKKNKHLYDSTMKEKETYEFQLNVVRNTGNHMSAIYKNILYFLENKKTQSKAILEAAISSTSSIVKDSELEGCTIVHNNGKTKILDGKGRNVNAREGSAARATMGFILRYTCLKAIPNKIQIMFLDEALATLSSETSMNLRGLLEEFSKDIGIVGIEQRNVLYSGISTKQYTVSKSDGISTVRLGG